MSQLTIINVVLEDRQDDGLRVYSDDLPGLILSGKDRSAVAALIVPSIEAIFKHKGFQGVIVRPAKPVHEVLRSQSPRNIDMHIQHEQFVVELPEAA